MFPAGFPLIGGMIGLIYVTIGRKVQTFLLISLYQKV